MFQDLRFGARMLWKQRGFTLVAVLTLALGIGATAAVFSLIQGVLLTPPPYKHPERLVLIPSARTDGQDTAHPRQWTPLQWMDWQREAKSFEAVGAYSWSFDYLVLPEGSQSMEGMYVTADYFRALGLQPVLGRTFVQAETGAKSPPAIILGHDLWQRQFGGDLNIIGKTVRISRWQTAPTVIGVMPEGVRFLPARGASQEPNYNVDARVDYWVPASPGQEEMKQAGWEVVARLKDGVTVGQAQAELTILTAREAQAEHDFEGMTAKVRPLETELNRDGRKILLPLLGAAALVLLISCGNAAALLLVRGLQRQQEYAVRSALGIGRIALFRQVSTESLLLALLGGGLGIALAFGIVRVFKSIGGHAIPRLDAVTTGWPVLLCGLGSAIVAALLAGVLPALRASRMDPIHVLKSAGPKSSAGPGERQILRGVTTVQTALTLALLVGAGLLIRTMMNLAKVESGYSTTHVLTMSVTAVGERKEWASFHHRALQQVSEIPGVEHAAFAWGVPLSGNSWSGMLDIEGQPLPVKPSDRIAVPMRALTPGYFQLLGQTITQGRDVRDTDSGQLSVAIVNQAFTDRFFPKASPIGRKMWLGPRDKQSIEIIGVVSNGRTEDLTHPSGPEIYFSLWQANAFSKTLAVRTAADPRTMVEAVRRTLRSVDPTVAVENVKTLDQIRDESVGSRTFAMQLLVGFALVGSVLTLVGIYGVLSLSIASRRREIAIRAAIGAERGDIRKLVFTEGFRLIAGGVAAGVAAALILSRVLRTFLFGVEPTDPVTLIGVGLLFVSVALLACWAPARRAAKINPIEALRYE